MAGPTRRRTFVATVVSAALHVAVLMVLALNAPPLRIPPMTSGPPEPVIPVIILPRHPPPSAGQAPPAPIRLHRRPQRFAPDTLPLAPLPAPPQTPAADAGNAKGPAIVRHPAPLPEGPKDQLRAALRAGDVGCANMDAVGMSRAEREACEERLGRGAKDAPFIHPGFGMSRAKKAEFDAAASARDARKAQMEAPASRPGPPVPSDYDGDPYVSGAGASALGVVTHPPSKRAAPKLGRLPP